VHVGTWRDRWLGREGRTAEFEGVSGVWKELTESVNQMAGNLTAQVRNIADVTIAGGQAVVPGVAGTWKDLTDSVNSIRLLSYLLIRVAIAYKNRR
jgi:hypothetical protein